MSLDEDAIRLAIAVALLRNAQRSQAENEENRFLAKKAQKLEKALIIKRIIRDRLATPTQKAEGMQVLRDCMEFLASDPDEMYDKRLQFYLDACISFITFAMNFVDLQEEVVGWFQVVVSRFLELIVQHADPPEDSTDPRPVLVDVICKLGETKQLGIVILKSCTKHLQATQSILGPLPSQFLLNCYYILVIIENLTMSAPRRWQNYKTDADYHEWLQMYDGLFAEGTNLFAMPKLLSSYLLRIAGYLSSFTIYHS